MSAKNFQIAYLLTGLWQSGVQSCNLQIAYLLTGLWQSSVQSVSRRRRRSPPDESDVTERYALCYKMTSVDFSCE